MLNLLDTLKKNHQDCRLLQNHPSNGIPEVSDIHDGVRDDSNWSHVVTPAMWNPEHVESPRYHEKSPLKNTVISKFV